MPESDGEVVDLLRRHGDEALMLAGGTFLHGLDARGLIAGVHVLIDLRRAGLGEVRSDQGGLRIGATATLRALDAAVDGAPWLAAAREANACPPVQIRNLGTVGGCIAAACPFFDLPVALAALDAQVDARGPQRTRTLRLDEFSAGLFESTLEAEEVLTDVRIPRPPPRTASAFAKIEGNASDLAIVNAAVRLTANDDGSCADARVVVGGGVGSTIVRARAVEEALAGAPLSGDGLSGDRIDDAADAVMADVHPVSDHRASAAYRGVVARVLVRRALRRAAATAAASAEGA